MSLIGSSTVAALAECSSIKEVERACVPNLWGEGLAHARSVGGSFKTRFFEVFDAVGWTSSRERTQRALEAARKAFHTFQNVLLHPTEENILPFSEVLSLSFDERWQQKCSRVNRLLNGEREPFRFAEVHRIIGPHIVCSATATSIPWEALESIAKGEALKAEKPFRQWIDELRRWGDFLSPLLMLSVCESAAVRALGKKDQDTITKAAFRILLELYTSGLMWLTEDDGGAVIERMIPLGPPITSVRLPVESSIKTYEDPSSPDSMIIFSPAPLYLGICLNYAAVLHSSIPSIHLEPRGSRHFLTAERLLFSCSALSWDRPGISTDRDRRLVEGIADLCASILKSEKTPFLDFENLFVTIHFKICSIPVLEDKWPFTCLPAIELFISSICHGDGERIRTVLDRSGFWESRTVQLYREIISDFFFRSIDDQVENTIWQLDLPRELVYVLLPWVQEAGNYARIAIEAIRASNSSTPVTLKSIAKTVLRLQRRDGFVALLPADLSERIIRESGAK